MSSPSPKYSNWMHSSPVASPMTNGFGTNESDPQKHIYMETTGANYSFEHQQHQQQQHQQQQQNSTVAVDHAASPHSFAYLSLQHEQHQQQQQQLDHQQHAQSNGQGNNYFDNAHQAHHHQHGQHEVHQPLNLPGSELAMANNQILMDMDESTPEFLPLCDLLFNIISLAAYFCDVVFDVVTVYTLYISEDKFWFMPTLFFVFCSSLISQALSLRWFTRRDPSSEKRVDWTQPGMIGVLLTHFFQCGILWRYFRLFVPVNLMTVKHEVRDLCMLRMVHAFSEAAPMLLIQFYLMWMKPYPEDITDLNVISTVLSLFSLCWALASFSKNARRQNIHKLVLTWLGVIFQFFWRIGTVGSRVVALTVYATVYHHWVFLVIALHWLAMLLWLMAPRHLFYGDRITFSKRFFYTVLVSWVYVLSYINLHESNTRGKMMAFYGLMFVENSALLGVCLLGFGSASSSVGVGGSGVGGPWFQEIAALLVWGGFLIGLLSMILYYKFFHIRYLKHTLLGSHYDDYPNGNHCPEHGLRGHHGGSCGLSSALDPSMRSNGLAINGKNLGLPSSANGMMSGIPGVFNCRLNPALKRKKKKPSTFVPPPTHVNGGPGGIGSGQASTTNATLVAMLSHNRALAKSPNGHHFLTQTLGAPPPPPPPANSFAKTSTGLVTSSKLLHHHHHHQQQHQQLMGLKYPGHTIATSPIPVSNGRMSAGPGAGSRVHAASPLNSPMNQMSGNQFNQNNLAAAPSLRMTPALDHQQQQQQHHPSLVTVGVDSSQGRASGGGGGGGDKASNRIASPRTTGLSDSDNLSSGSRVNVQQKLQEKKQQQLMQLREIEEEMKQGKIHPLDRMGTMHHDGLPPPPLLPRSFPPQAKKQPWLSQRPEVVSSVGVSRHTRHQRLANGIPPLPHYYYHPGFRRMKIRSHTPEVLLSPHYLEKSRIYYDYPSGMLPPSIPGYLTPHIGMPIEGQVDGSSEDDEPRYRHTRTHHGLPMSIRSQSRMAKVKFSQSRPELLKPIAGVHLPPACPASDIESQLSLPRSYTLPRQFRYYKGNVFAATTKGRGGRKPIRVENFSSNNSSDGDVDSDVNEAAKNSAAAAAAAVAQQQQLQHQHHHHEKVQTQQQQQQHQSQAGASSLTAVAAPAIRPRTYANHGSKHKNETPL